MRSLAVFLLLLPCFLRAQETPERLRWTIDQATAIEKSLRAASLSAEYNLLLRNLANAEKQFALVSNADIQCPDVRTAAERGREWCNPYGVKAEADLNGLIERATKARIQAINLNEAANFCLKAITPIAEQPDLTSADVLAHSAAIARNDINYGLRARDNRVLAFDLEHAIRLIHDAEQVAFNLQGCEAYIEAAKKASQACTDALLSSTWAEIEKNCLKALDYLDIMQAEAKCK